MNFSDKKIYMAVTFVCISLLAGALLITMSITPINQPAEPTAQPVMAETTVQTGSISFKVLDGETGAHLKDVCVVALDTDTEFLTDDQGLTGKIEVPIIPDTRFDKINRKSWGETSMVFYKEGYAPYALFYVQVQANKYRENVEILMFKSDQKSSALSIIEGPQRDWVDAIVSKYEPGDKKAMP